MIGKKQIQIDARQFLQGMASSDYMPDGGIGTSSYNLNPVRTPGVLCATHFDTADGDGVSTDDLIASCEDPREGNSSELDRVFVDTDGCIYGLSSGDEFDKMKTPSSTTGYTRNITDMISFDGDVYITKTTDVVKASVSGSTWTLDEDWWTDAEGNAALVPAFKHPMIVFEGFLWIADGKSLHNVDESGVSNEDVLEIGSNERIESLGIDPGSGLMMIGVTTILDSGNDLSSANYVMLYDGYSAYVRRKIPIQGKPTSFINVGGQVFVTYDNLVGIWNGSGITFLRRLQTEAESSTTITYRQKVTAIGNLYVVVEDNKLLAYGDISPGKKVWFPIYKNLESSAAEIELATFCGNEDGGNLLVNFADTQIRLVKLFDPSSGAGKFYSPFYNFERPIFVRKVRIFTDGINTTSGIGSMGIIDELGVTRTPTVSTFVVSAAQSPKRVFDFDYGGLKLQTAQLVVGLDTQAYDFIRAIIYYDVAE